MGKCKKTIGKSRKISEKLGIEWIDLLRNVVDGKHHGKIMEDPL